LSLATLIDALKTVQLQNPMEQRLQAIKTHVEPLKEHRHNRIAHLNLSHALNKFVGLPPVTVGIINDSLRLLREFMNELEEDLLYGPHNYQAVAKILHSHGDVPALIVHLRRSLRMIALAERVLTDTIKPDELRNEVHKENLF
jgi:hypothetical protein